MIWFIFLNYLVWLLKNSETRTSMHLILVLISDMQWMWLGKVSTNS